MNDNDFELFQEFLAFKKMQEQCISLEEKKQKKKSKEEPKQKKKTKYTKRKDGYYGTSVFVGRDENGKRINKYLQARTIAELDIKVRELKAELSKGTDFFKREMTFKTFREKWFENKQLKIKTHNTYAMYMNIFTYLTSLDTLQLKDITSDHIQMIINEKKEHPRTCQKIKMCLNEIFKQAIAERIIYYNPCDLVVIPKYKVNERRPLTEVENYITNQDIFDDTEKAYISLIKYCGLRKEEALALTKDCFDLETRKLKIYKAIFYKKNRPYEKSTKNEKTRFVPIPNKIYNFISYYLSNLETDILFYSDFTKSYYCDSTYRMFWKKIMKKIITYANNNNLEIGTDLTAHIFRHNYACMLMNANVEMKERQYLLGHSSINVTMDIYTHIEANKMQAPNLLNNFLI